MNDLIEGQFLFNYCHVLIKFFFKDKKRSRSRSLSETSTSASSSSESDTAETPAVAPPAKKEAGSSRASPPPKEKVVKKKKKAKRANLSDASSASEDEDELQLAALKSLFLKKMKKKDRVKKDKKKVVEVEQVVVDPAKKYSNLSSRERIVAVIEDNRHVMKPQDFPILYSMSSIWSVFDLDTRNRIMNNYCSCQQRQYPRDRFPPSRGAPLPRGRGRPYY